MRTLQALIESILIDVINARFEADVRAAELAELYLEDETLRALQIPTLNISGLSVELRVAFDDSPIETAEGPSEEQAEVIESSADKLRKLLMNFSSVKEGLSAPRARAGLSRSVNVAVRNALTSELGSTSSARRRAVESEVVRILAHHDLSLSKGEKKEFRSELEALDVKLELARKAPPGNVPAVIVGAGRLKELEPEKVSSIRFEIDLAHGRWGQVEDEDGRTRSVITDA